MDALMKAANAAGCSTTAIQTTTVMGTNFDFENALNNILKTKEVIDVQTNSFVAGQDIMYTAVVFYKEVVQDNKAALESNFLK